MRNLLIIAALALTTFATAQTFTVGFKANLHEAAVLATIEVATGQISDLRISPIVQAQFKTDYTDVSGHVMGGLQIAYLPPDSKITVIATLLYRHVWRSPSTPNGPEIAVTVVF